MLANSFPKSGTHLLVQILEGLPDRVNYGAFLGSETSSFQLRERSPANTCGFIRGFVPGEIIRGHLYYEPLYADELAKRHTVNYFIYRDPRDVVVSEAHYLRDMNRWHKLHRYFREAASMEDAIMLSINGLDPPVPGIPYPNIAERFNRYIGWLDRDDCLSIRFEDLVSERQGELIRQIAEFYAPRTTHALRRRSRRRPHVDAHRPPQIAHLPQRQEGRLGTRVHARPPRALRRARRRHARPTRLRAQSRLGRAPVAVH